MLMGIVETLLVDFDIASVKQDKVLLEQTQVFVIRSIASLAGTACGLRDVP